MKIRVGKCLTIKNLSEGRNGKIKPIEYTKERKKR